ncbi:Transcription factor of the Forkhead/HNF3 family [Trachipleistophora hominis]|uniref:Transcription factor of the Forkhead/HNF3 family n=1 Tax=Trachipleistophora hominis TaxID=72359 RepID=L7JRS3_TRAHO|nr:Transcription factor of the Forkhead/HNF3 family [Trachipleistophora hominis]
MMSCSPDEENYKSSFLKRLLDFERKMNEEYANRTGNTYKYTPMDVLNRNNDDSEKMYVDPRIILDENDSNSAPLWYSNACNKPAYSYSQLITQALESNADKKLTLSQIYAFIKDKYAYYRHADPVWQNSIRHNLSLNKNFKKVQRPQNMPGKGGFWILDKTSDSEIDEPESCATSSECKVHKQQEQTDKFKFLHEGEPVEIKYFQTKDDSLFSGSIFLRNV